MRRGRLAICLAASSSAASCLSKQMSCKLPKHQPVTSGRKMIVSQNEKMFVPVPVGFGRGEEDRKQVDELLAPALTEFAPQRNLPAVTISLRKLLGPGIDHDRQGNISRRQQIGHSPHVVQGSRDAALNSKRLVVAGDVQARNYPAHPRRMRIEPPWPVADKGLNRPLEKHPPPVGDHEAIDKEIRLLRRRGLRLGGALRRAAIP